jgi:beta-lactam-binding protein with PASTA domain
MAEETEKLRRELQIAQETIRVKDQRILDLNTEVQSLRMQVATLQKARPKLSPKNLISSFQTALVRMQEGLEVGEARVNYVVGGFDTDLKVAVTLDDEGKIAFQLPELEDVVPFENLSTMRLSLVPVGRPPTLPPQTAEVPNLIGMSKEAAVEAIERAKFKVGNIEEQISTTAPGTVIGQNPDRFYRSQVESPIDLTISKVRNAKVPSVLGIGREDAIEVIRAARFTVGEITEQVSDSPAGTVIWQSIAADTLVPIETQIDLLIAKPKMATVPNVVGKPVDEARTAVEEAELEVGQVAEKESRQPTGTVLGQQPEAGETVRVGTTVDITVSKIEKAVVPDLSGLTREKAEKVAAENHLKIGDVIRRRSRKLAGTVIGQRPDPGTKVPTGTSIGLTVSRGWGPPG